MPQRNHQALLFIGRRNEPERGVVKSFATRRRIDHPGRFAKVRSDGAQSEDDRITKGGIPRQKRDDRPADW